MLIWSLPNPTVLLLVVLFFFSYALGAGAGKRYAVGNGKAVMH
jgi:hypothetical protein